jgi:micrococcal nuclease
VVAAALLLPALATAGSTKTKAVVDHVADGDTIKVVLGHREEYVRFIGIDTPEVYDTPECGGPQASAAMKRMLKPGDRVTLVRDRTQDNRDTYDRLLRYVQFHGRDLGLVQAKKGWADVFVFDEPWKRLAAYDRAAERAKDANRGVWRLCGGFPG